MFCPNCGTQNDDNGVKCQKCGFNLKGAAAPKFKGTMLMMNSPAAQAPRPAAPPGVPPGQAPWPKSAAKATMIGVAPPSPGAVVPPPNKGPVAPPVSGAPTPLAPPVGHAPSIPRPVPPAPAAGGVPVNPFGGTMLMGAVPPAQSPAAIPSGGQALSDRTFTSEGAPLPNLAEPIKLESTTPSASPPPPGIAATQNDMAAIGMADTAPPPAALANASKLAAAVDKSHEAVVVSAPAIQASSRKIRPIGLVVLLGFVTFGIYWLIALYGSLNDFNSIRQKNDINPIRFLIPILGLLEMIKLPGKVVETRAAVGVSNPVPPNVVLYILFPQIFFIADVNELVETTAKRTSIS